MLGLKHKYVSVVCPCWGTEVVTSMWPDEKSTRVKAKIYFLASYSICP